MSKTEKQYEEIYRRYANDIYKICVYYLQDEKQAQEVVIEAFESLYKHLDEVNPKYTLAYLANEAKTIIKGSQIETLTSKEVTQE